MTTDPTEHSLEALQPNLTPEEACLSALLDLNEFQEVGPGKSVGAFYTAFTGYKPTENLSTRISTHAVEQSPQDPPHFSPQRSYVDGYEIAATVVVNFDDREADVRDMLNLDFVKTDDGLVVMRRELFRVGEGVEPRYTQRLTEGELAALAQDAATTRELIVEENAELMKLGPLEEAAAEDGTRRFHIGDVLTVTTGRLVSPRGVDGLYDILGYMTDDSPYTTQLGRFADECSPVLEQRLGEVLKPYSDIPVGVKDSLSLYRWLYGITQAMDGDPFLEIGKIGEEDHATIDPVTEMELDYGSEIRDKMITLDPETFGQDED